jgi:hypothetical protein
VAGKRNDLPLRSDIKSAKKQKYFDSVVANPTVLFDPRNSSKHILYPARFVDCIIPAKSNPFLRS